MSKKLPLENSKQFATVDIDDYDWAKNFTWKQNETGHVVRTDAEDFFLCNGVMAKRMYGSWTYHFMFGPPSTKT